ncbi:beta-1,4-N-acetylgalactosaminyltransferase bre-4-like, partial [Saccostrea cucullata]|uniref:beta-1,4-N-acetylgalactosaminyltransferase bre-4-like n=1 Tax=Saccostrea cuccullata TaxID=36930 RepID=UPI002ED00F29
MRQDEALLSRGNIFRACVYAVVFLVLLEISISVSFLKQGTYRLLKSYEVLKKWDISRFTLILAASQNECDWMVNATIKDLQRILESECQPVRVCSISPPALVGQLETYKSAPPYEELIKLFPLVKPGGRYTPYECISRERVAIIIPFRDREEHLRILLHNLHPILQRQQLDYGIYVIEQISGFRSGKTPFKMISGDVVSLDYLLDRLIGHIVEYLSSTLK